MSRRTRMTAFHPVSVALLMVLPAAVAAQDAAAGIAKSNGAFEEAVAAGDVGAMIDLYTQDAMVMAPNAPAARGHEAIRAAFEGMLEGVGSVDLTTDELETFGDTAYEVGGYVLEGPDGTHLDHGKYIVIWKRTPNGWKLHRDIFNSDMALPEGH